jgi:hypothetical protein
MGRTPYPYRSGKKNPSVPEGFSLGFSRASEGNRTLGSSLGSWGITIIRRSPVNGLSPLRQNLIPDRRPFCQETTAPSSAMMFDRLNRLVCRYDGERISGQRRFPRSGSLSRGRLDGRFFLFHEVTDQFPVLERQHQHGIFGLHVRYRDPAAGMFHGEDRPAFAHR